MVFPGRHGYGSPTAYSKLSQNMPADVRARGRADLHAHDYGAVAELMAQVEQP